MSNRVEATREIGFLPENFGDRPLAITPIPEKPLRLMDRLSRISVDSNSRPLLAMVGIDTNQDKVVPKDCECLIPSETTSISSLLDTSLPSILTTMSLLRTVESCVVCDEPSWTKDQLISTSVPSAQWLKDLDQAIGKGRPNGAKSVEDPRNTNIRFPLWVGTFWTALSGVIEEQKEWRRAREWIDTLIEGETDEVQAIFDRLPRKTPVWVLASEADRAVTKISFFARMLSDRFFAERHIDAFVSYLNIQVRKCKPSAPGVFVADLPLSIVLSNYSNAPAHKIHDCELFLRYTAIFKSKAYHRLLFPAHVGGRDVGHWVVFSVDFIKAEYGFGKSRGHADRLTTHPFSCQFRKLFKRRILRKGHRKNQPWAGSLVENKLPPFQGPWPNRTNWNPGGRDFVWGMRSECS